MTPQEAAAHFGGKSYNWYPDYYQSGNSVAWDGTTWVFQDSPLNAGISLRSDGNYVDAKGTVLKLPIDQRGRMWNYFYPLDYPTLRLGQLGLEGRARMFMRTDHAPAYPMTKRWGYGSVTFDQSEGGVLRIVGCSSDQLAAAAQDSANEYNSDKPDKEGYRILLWNEATKRFEAR